MSQTGEKRFEHRLTNLVYALENEFDSFTEFMKTVVKPSKSSEGRHVKGSDRVPNLTAKLSSNEIYRPIETVYFEKPLSQHVCSLIDMNKSAKKNPRAISNQCFQASKSSSQNQCPDCQKDSTSGLKRQAPNGATGTSEITVKDEDERIRETPAFPCYQQCDNGIVKLNEHQTQSQDRRHEDDRWDGNKGKESSSESEPSNRFSGQEQLIRYLVPCDDYETNRLDRMGVNGENSDQELVAGEQNGTSELYTYKVPEYLEIQQCKLPPYLEQGLRHDRKYAILGEEVIPVELKLLDESPESQDPSNFEYSQAEQVFDDIESQGKRRSQRALAQCMENCYGYLTEETRRIMKECDIQKEDYEKLIAIPPANAEPGSRNYTQYGPRYNVHRFDETRSSRLEQYLREIEPIPEPGTYHDANHIHHVHPEMRGGPTSDEDTYIRMPPSNMEDGSRNYAKYRFNESQRRIPPSLDPVLQECIERCNQRFGSDTTKESYSKEFYSEDSFSRQKPRGYTPEECKEFVEAATQCDDLEFRKRMDDSRYNPNYNRQTYSQPQKWDTGLSSEPPVRNPEGFQGHLKETYQWKSGATPRSNPEPTSRQQPQQNEPIWLDFMDSTNVRTTVNSSKHYAEPMPNRVRASDSSTWERLLEKCLELAKQDRKQDGNQSYVESKTFSSNRTQAPRQNDRVPDHNSHVDESETYQWSESEVPSRSGEPIDGSRYGGNDLPQTDSIALKRILEECMEIMEQRGEYDIVDKRVETRSNRGQQRKEPLGYEHSFEQSASSSNRWNKPESQRKRGEPMPRGKGYQQGVGEYIEPLDDTTQPAMPPTNRYWRQDRVLNQQDSWSSQLQECQEVMNRWREHTKSKERLEPIRKNSLKNETQPSNKYQSTNQWKETAATDQHLEPGRASPRQEELRKNTSSRQEMPRVGDSLRQEGSRRSEDLTSSSFSRPEDFRSYTSRERNHEDSHRSIPYRKEDSRNNNSTKPEELHRHEPSRQEDFRSYTSRHEDSHRSIPTRKEDSQTINSTNLEEFRRREPSRQEDLPRREPSRQEEQRKITTTTTTTRRLDDYRDRPTTSKPSLRECLEAMNRWNQRDMEHTYEPPLEKTYEESTEKMYAEPMERTYPGPEEDIYDRPTERTYVESKERTHVPPPMERTNVERIEKTHISSSNVSNARSHTTSNKRPEPNRSFHESSSLQFTRPSAPKGETQAFKNCVEECMEAMSQRYENTLPRYSRPNDHSPQGPLRQNKQQVTQSRTNRSYDRYSAQPLGPDYEDSNIKDDLDHLKKRRPFHTDSRANNVDRFSPNIEPILETEESPNFHTEESLFRMHMEALNADCVSRLQQLPRSSQSQSLEMMLNEIMAEELLEDSQPTPTPTGTQEWTDNRVEENGVPPDNMKNDDRVSREQEQGSNMTVQRNEMPSSRTQNLRKQVPSSTSRDEVDRVQTEERTKVVHKGVPSSSFREDDRVDRVQTEERTKVVHKGVPSSSSREDDRVDWVQTQERPQNVHRRSPARTTIDDDRVDRVQTEERTQDVRKVVPPRSPRDDEHVDRVQTQERIQTVHKGIPPSNVRSRDRMDHLQDHGSTVQNTRVTTRRETNKAQQDDLPDEEYDEYQRQMEQLTRSTKMRGQKPTRHETEGPLHRELTDEECAEFLQQLKRMSAPRHKVVSKLESDREQRSKMNNEEYLERLQQQLRSPQNWSRSSNRVEVSGRGGTGRDVYKKKTGKDIYGKGGSDTYGKGGRDSHGKGTGSDVYGRGGGRDAYGKRGGRDVYGKGPYPSSYLDEDCVSNLQKFSKAPKMRSNIFDIFSSQTCDAPTLEPSTQNKSLKRPATTPLEQTPTSHLSDTCLSTSESPSGDRNQEDAKLFANKSSYQKPRANSLQRHKAVPVNPNRHEGSTLTFHVQEMESGGVERMDSTESINSFKRMRLKESEEDRELGERFNNVLIPLRGAISIHSSQVKCGLQGHSLVSALRTYTVGQSHENSTPKRSKPSGALTPYSPLELSEILVTSTTDKSNDDSAVEYPSQKISSRKYHLNEKPLKKKKPPKCKLILPKNKSRSGQCLLKRKTGQSLDRRSKKSHDPVTVRASLESNFSGITDCDFDSTFVSKNQLNSTEFRPVLCTSRIAEETIVSVASGDLKNGCDMTKRLKDIERAILSRHLEEALRECCESARSVI